MEESLEIESSLLTRPSQREAKIKGLAMEVIQQVEEGVMVEETGQQVRMTASNVAGQAIGHEIAHQLVVAEVLVPSPLLALSTPGLVPVETVIQMFVIGTWMINMIEVAMMIEIVMKSGMIAMGAAIDILMTGTLQLETDSRLTGFPLLLTVTL